MTIHFHRNTKKRLTMAATVALSALVAFNVLTLEKAAALSAVVASLVAFWYPGPKEHHGRPEDHAERIPLTNEQKETLSTKGVRLP